MQIQLWLTNKSTCYANHVVIFEICLENNFQTAKLQQKDPISTYAENLFSG